MGLFIYSPSLQAPFQLDDYLVIVDNPAVYNFTNLKAMWNYDPSRFLTHSSFALNYYFDQLNVRGYHALNLIIHLAVVLWVYMLSKLTIAPLLGRQRGEWLSIFGALIFLTHPIQTSAVTYVAQRSSLLLAFFYLSSLACYVYAHQNNSRKFYMLSLLAAFLGLFSKPTIVTLPLAIIVYEICFLVKRKDAPRAMLKVIPFLAIAALAPVLLILWRYKILDLTQLANITRETATLTRSEYFFTQLNVLMTYIRLLFLPIYQNLDYDYAIAKSLFSMPTIISFMGLLLLLGLGIRLYSKQRLIAVGIFWFFITLSLESSFFPITDVIFEHRLYLPMVGFVFLLPSLLEFFLKKEKIVSIVLIGIIIGYSYLSFERNRLWSDKIVFLKDIVAKSPQKARVHNNLGLAYYERNQIDLAMDSYNTALKLDPDYPEGYCNRGQIYQDQGKYSLALKDFQRALEIRPVYAPVYSNRGYIYGEQGRYELAFRDFEQALKLNPYYVNAYNNRGIIYQKRKQYPLALKDFNQAIDINPRFADAYNNRAIVYIGMEDLSGAIKDFQRAIELNPNYSLAKKNLEQAIRLNNDQRHKQ